MKDYIRTTILGGVVLCVPPKDMEELHATTRRRGVMRMFWLILGISCVYVGVATRPTSTVAPEAPECYNGTTSAIDASKKTPYEPEEKTCP